MNTLSSPDGTTIAYDQQGEGPALILVDGALTVRSAGPAFLYGHSSGGPLAMRAAIRLGRKVSPGRPWKPSRRRWPTTTPPSWVSPGRCRPRWPRVFRPVPALVLAGDAGLPFMAGTARSLSQAIPRGQLRILKGQTHEATPAALTPALLEFF